MSQADGSFDLDAARGRLEDLLLALPFDRALPDLDVLLARAGVPAAALRRDDRLVKVLHEAILARPFGDGDEVARTRTEVELLTLEVEVLTDQVGPAAAHPDEVARAEARIAEIRRRLAQIRAQL